MVRPLAALACLAALGACSAEQAPWAAHVPPPPQSATCTSDTPESMGADIPATMTLNNDGGWCSTAYVTWFNGMRTGAPTRLEQPPANGQVRIVVLREYTRISYRPNPGFIGPDRFVILNEMLNRPRTYNVSVMQ